MSLPHKIKININYSAFLFLNTKQAAKEAARIPANNATFSVVPVAVVAFPDVDVALPLEPPVVVELPSPEEAAAPCVQTTASGSGVSPSFVPIEDS